MKSRLQRASTPRRRRLAALTSVLFAVLLLPAAQGQAADLFTSVDEPPPSSIASDDLTLRSRLVRTLSTITIVSVRTANRLTVWNLEV